MQRLRLSEADWLKLRDYAKAMSTKIQKKLPEDWTLDLNEIEGAVYDTFIHYLNNYKDGAMSPVSYCYRFAELATFRDLIREYKQLKQQDTLDSLREDGREYGKGYVKSLVVDDTQTLETKLQANELLDKMPKLDRMIAQMIMEGKSLRQISEEVGLDKMTIQRRMKKYGSK